MQLLIRLLRKKLKQKRIKTFQIAKAHFQINTLKVLKKLSYKNGIKKKTQKIVLKIQDSNRIKNNKRLYKEKLNFFFLLKKLNSREN